jgi:hypothetical protein
MIPLALTITYTIVPFLKGAGGRLYAGVIVLKERSDPAEGIFLEPLLT